MHNIVPVGQPVQYAHQNIEKFKKLKKPSHSHGSRMVLSRVHTSTKACQAVSKTKLIAM